MSRAVRGDGGLLQRRDTKVVRPAVEQATATSSWPSIRYRISCTGSGACRQADAPEPASSHQVGTRWENIPWRPSLAEWEGMTLPPCEVTILLGDRSCWMALVSLSNPAGTGAVSDLAATKHSPMPHPRNRQCHGSNGDLPRVFTADTLMARQSLPSQDVRVSPLASIPAITEVIRPEEAGCSRGPADRISGASAGRSGEAIQRWHAFRDDPSVSHPVPRSRPPSSFAIAGIATERIVAGLCLQPPIRFP